MSNVCMSPDESSSIRTSSQQYHRQFLLEFPAGSCVMYECDKSALSDEIVLHLPAGVLFKDQLPLLPVQLP